MSSYVLNGRLFPIPVHHHSEPGILCPVCEGSHDQNGTEPEGVASARYIKVSIPRCTFQPVSRLRTRRKRRSPKSSGRSPESATESMGLSKVGTVTARPRPSHKTYIHHEVITCSLAWCNMCVLLAPSYMSVVHIILHWLWLSLPCQSVCDRQL